MVSFNEVKRFAISNKEGIIIGGLVGFLLGKFFLSSQIDFSLVNQSFGLIDVIQEGSRTAVEITKTKIVWASTILGAGIGLLIDMNLKERRFF